MSEYGTVLEAGTVRFERLLPGPIERIGAYLTESDKRGQWLATGPMDLRVGGDVELTFRQADPSPQTGPKTERYKDLEGGHTFHGRITRFDPPRLLSYSRGGEPGGGANPERVGSERRV